MDFKRQAFAERDISEINPEKDIAVALVGRVIDKKQNIIILDDGSGKANVFFTDENILNNLSVNDIIRLSGFVMPTQDGFDIRGEIVQNMDKLDVELYKKIKNING